MKKTTKAGQLQMTVVTSTTTLKKRNTAGKVTTKSTKTAKIEVAPAASTSNVNPNDWKNAKHNRKFPLVKASRTDMVNMINASKGRFFTSTHIDANGNARTMNCIKSNKPASELGYIPVYSVLDCGDRQINPQTITELSFAGIHYYSGKKPKMSK